MNHSKVHFGKIVQNNLSWEIGKLSADLKNIRRFLWHLDFCVPRRGRKGGFPFENKSKHSDSKISNYSCKISDKKAKIRRSEFLYKFG